MKMPILIPLFLFALATASAQTTAVVSPAPSKPLTIATTPFGMDQKVTLGNLDKSGKATVDLEMDFSKIPETVKKDYWITIAELFGFCDNFQELFSNEKELEALETGPLFLFADEEIAGFITLVSDPAMCKWVNDPGYGDAVPGSYFELVYVGRNFDFKGSCVQTTNLEDGNLETSYEIGVDLGAGFNFIEYKVESVHAGSEEMAASPKRVVVSSHSEIPENALWMAYYY